MSENNSDRQFDDRSPEERNLRTAMGKRLRQSRKRKHWTQAELALKLGVRRAKLSRWEMGALPPLRMLILLSEVLEMSLDALLAGRSTDREDALTQDQKKAAVLHLNQLAGLLRLRPREPRD